MCGSSPQIAVGDRPLVPGSRAYSAGVPTVAVIPVRAFAEGNRRLAGMLDERERVALCRSLACHVAETVEAAGLLPLVATADPEVAVWATGKGFPSVPDPGEGLDAAAATGVDWARRSGSRWLVLHADLPLLVKEDLAAFGARSGELIAPSADGGTSAISAGRPIRFSYGPGSFHRHLGRLRDPVIVARVGFLHDVDSPRDLLSSRSHPRGRWLAA